ncbi:MAG: hypothetical protein DMG30_17945 [Acidobacteria bacterium]|nr:MAG: hypothetical protein DMG30_17945 [Acidobacteriota bacterium]
MLAAYERITSFRETNPNAIVHRRVSISISVARPTPWRQTAGDSQSENLWSLQEAGFGTE